MWTDGHPGREYDPENPLHKQMLRLSILCNDSTNIDGKEMGIRQRQRLLILETAWRSGRESKKGISTFKRDSF